MNEQTTTCNNKYELYNVESNKPDTQKTIIFHLFEAQKQAKRLLCQDNKCWSGDIAAGRGHTCMGLLECW